MTPEDRRVLQGRVVLGKGQGRVVLECVRKELVSERGVVSDDICDGT